jgi:glycosyltransferase involved in cell wall biosynthesis
MASGTPLISVLHAAEIIKGGICTYLRELITLQAHSESVGRIVVVIPRSQQEDLKLPVNVELVTFADGSNRIMNSVKLARTVARVVGETAPDVIHIHSSFAGAMLRPTLAFMRVRSVIIYCPHGWAFERDVRPLIKSFTRFFERVLSNWCHAIVCVAQFERMAGIRAGIRPDKLVVIRNGISKLQPSVDNRSAVSWPQNRRRLLFVGRYDRQKGVDVLFRALRNLQDEAFAFVIGGSVRNVQVADAPQNARCISWLSADEIQPYYESADVVVIPSRWEGLPLVAIEAMRAGATVVATAVGGIPEIVEDGVTGILVPSDDSNALVIALRSLTESDLQRLGAAGQQRIASEFTLERVHAEILDLYASLANSPAAIPFVAGR